MRFRLFILADNEKDALTVYDGCMEDIKDYITEQLVFGIEPYWKFPDSYVITVEFRWNIDQKQFEHFLDSICNSWLVTGGNLGYDEMLASATSNCTRFIKDKVEMFIISMEEDERWLISEDLDYFISGYDAYYEDGEWCYRHK